MPKIPRGDSLDATATRMPPRGDELAPTSPLLLAMETDADRELAALLDGVEGMNFEEDEGKNLSIVPASSSSAIVAYHPPAESAVAIPSGSCFELFGKMCIITNGIEGVAEDFVPVPLQFVETFKQLPLPCVEKYLQLLHCGVDQVGAMQQVLHTSLRAPSSFLSELPSPALPALDLTPRQKAAAIKNAFGSAYNIVAIASRLDALESSARGAIPKVVSEFNALLSQILVAFGKLCRNEDSKGVLNHQIKSIFEVFVSSNLEVGGVIPPFLQEVLVSFKDHDLEGTFSQLAKCFEAFAQMTRLAKKYNALCEEREQLVMKIDELHVALGCPLPPPRVARSI